MARLKEDLREAEVARRHTEATAVSAREAVAEATANARRAERRVGIKTLQLKISKKESLDSKQNNSG